MTTQTEILQFLVQTEGATELGQLAKSMLDAGQAGEAASPEIQKLVEEFGRLSQLSETVSGLPALKAQLVDVGNQLFLAKERATDLGTALAASEAPTASQTRALQRAQAAVAGLESQQTKLSVAIKTSENALLSAGVSTENLDAADRQLQGSLAQTRAEAAGLAAGLKQAAAAGEAEAASLTEIAERNAVLRSGFEQLKELLTTFAGLLALEKLKEDTVEILNTGSKFEAWGLQFKNAFGSAEAGEAALERVKQIAETTPLSLDQVTAAALQAKKEGLDPLDNSFQTIIETAVKFGGGAAEVSEIITALGKSANEGGLNIRTLTALEQQGIPAAALLGQALGKTADQVTELAKQGKLGADSVATLIQQIGKHSAGGLDEEMNLLSSQVKVANENYESFLELVAKSGVYDYVKSQLHELNQAFKEGLASGQLQQTAKNISDGLITLGRTLVSITQFVTENGSTIITLTEQYALFKAVMLGLDLLGAAQRFLGLAEATKAAGVAAEVAAAESGGFGKLRNAINRIPRTVQVAVAVAGVVDAVTETVKLIGTLNDYYDLNQKVLAQQQDDATVRAKLLALAEQTAQRTAAAANTQIASAEQLAAKNRDQSQSYIDSLQNAIRYFESLKVQDEALGDNAGAAAASEKVRQYITALDEAAKHQKSLSDSIAEMSGKVTLVVDEFDKLYSGGATAAEAIQKAFDNIEIHTPKGFDAVLAILKRVDIESKDARDAVQTELANALSKLDSVDLRQFQDNVVARIQQLGTSSRETTQALQASLQAELLQLGLSAEQAGLKFTDSGQKIIDTFGSIARNAQASGATIQLAFAQALSKASTEGEVDALKSELQQAFDAGRIGADQFSVAMAAAGRRTADIQVAAIQAGASLDGMGTSGTTAAQNISNALQDARDKLVVQANDMAKAIATALQQDGNAEELKAQLKGVEAQIASLNKQIENTGNTAPPSLGKVAQGTRQIAETTSDANAAVDKATKAAEAGYTEWGDAADAASLATKHITADTSHANDAMNALTQGIADARAGFLAVSQAAAQFYDTTLKAAFDAGHTDDGAGFDRVARAMQEALDVTTRKIADQRSQIANEIATINQLGTDSHKSLGSFGDDADKASAKMSALAELIREGKYQAGLLGQADLVPLEQALEAAAQRAQQLADQTKQAVAQFEDLAQSAQDAYDQEAGNNEDIEDRRHAKQLQDLLDAAKAAGKLNSDQYKQAVDYENKLHALKLRDIEAEKDAQNGSGASDTASSSSPRSSSKSNGGIGGGGTGGGSSNGCWPRWSRTDPHSHRWSAAGRGAVWRQARSRDACCDPACEGQQHMRFTYKSLDDVAGALVELACLIWDVDEVSSDRRAAHVTRHHILVQGAMQRKANCRDGSLAQQLLEFIASPSNASKPKLSIVRQP